MILAKVSSSICVGLHALKSLMSSMGIHSTNLKRDLDFLNFISIAASQVINQVTQVEHPLLLGIHVNNFRVS